MSYSNVPLAGQSLGDTRADINTNFSLIKTISDVNHVNFGAAGQGNHKFVIMRSKTASAYPLNTGGDEGALFVDPGTNPAQQNLWFMAESTGKIYQLTNVNSNADAMTRFGDNVFETSGWTFLPGGLIMQYGSRPGASTVTVTYPIPFTSAVYSINVSHQRATGTAGELTINTNSLTGMTINGSSSSGSRTVFWQAIGK